MPDIAYVSVAPECVFCRMESDKQVPAEYDFKTYDGRWANGCEPHWKALRFYDTLGTGKGQRLIVGEEPVKTRAEVRADIHAALDAGDMDAAFEAMGDGDISDFL